MNKREWAEEVLQEVHPGALFMDGFDEAIIGITTEDEPRVVYSEQDIIKVLMDDGASEEDAWDHYGYNVLGSLRNETPYPIIVRGAWYDEAFLPDRSEEAAAAGA